MANLSVDTMLQRQMEVSGGLRNPVKTPEELLDVHGKIVGLAKFFVRISRVATRMQTPLEAVFQCLMQMGLGEEGVDFDKQHRQGNVPMHQAKVLDRNSSLAAKQVEPKLRDTVADPDEMEHLIGQCQLLRVFLRMKVEDGNDLSMARKLVSLSEEYLQCIFEIAKGEGKAMWMLWAANDAEELRAAKLAASGGEGGVGASPGKEGRPAGKPLPRDLVKGVAAETTNVRSNKVAVADRLECLACLQWWMETAEESQVLDNFAGVVAALHEPLKIQLAEKRSAVCRAACDLVSLLCLRSQPQHFALPKVREVFSAWIDVLLKSVHVTVGPIAEACDATVRDMVVASLGAGYITMVLCNVIHKTTQNTQRRKVLGYVALAIVSAVDKTAFLACAPLSQKYASSSDDATRRASRLVGILLAHYDPDAASKVAWDAKVAKLAAGETKEVVDHLGSVEEFEMMVLKYQDPCKASMFHGEKASGCPRSSSAFAVASPHSGLTSLPVPTAEPRSAEEPQQHVEETSPMAKQRLAPRVETKPRPKAAPSTTTVAEESTKPEKKVVGRPSIAELRAQAKAKKATPQQDENGGFGAVHHKPKPKTAVPKLQEARRNKADPLPLPAFIPQTAEEAMLQQPDKRAVSANVLPLSLMSLSATAPAPSPEPTTPSEFSALCSTLKRRSVSREASPQ